ncbi:glycerophosphoryl diester phosphodiesterase [Chitinophaga jiangningensis]|uniref:Glycerophosphoryl diester phosphodiesterase n=1 Tax=Chitinophaga jiangningensis TaxID=1419482 RepID=A0A1M7DNN2_9BACT|nr:glycerophosphodiester phosphodiesterase family protein [Chitinophaga jiangningensis]SHL81008.1 glycerophosphoryl diester phosphodiesterase [Chitinophaga jiangningensis]
MKTLVPFLLGAALITTSAHAQYKPDVQAHRGGMGLMPENTIPAMINAVKLGARTLELDCIITADNQVVVSHDAYMSSTFMRKPDGTDISKEEQKKLTLFSMPYDSIRKYDAGTKPHERFPQQQKFKTYRPLLSELIDSVEAYVKQHRLKPVYYNMETKSDPTADGRLNPTPDVFVARVMEVINEKKIASRVTIQSFDKRTLQELHKKYPKQTTAWLIANKQSFAENIKDLGFTPDIYSPAFQLVTPELIAEAHAMKVKVLPWTVDETADLQKMLDMKVDGIITNYPDRLIKLTGSYQ